MVDGNHPLIVCRVCCVGAGSCKLDFWSYAYVVLRVFKIKIRPLSIGGCFWFIGLIGGTTQLRRTFSCEASEVDLIVGPAPDSYFLVLLKNFGFCVFLE